MRKALLLAAMMLGLTTTVAADLWIYDLTSEWRRLDVSRMKGADKAHPAT